MTTPADDIKNYTWRDKEYYKLYQRELYKKRLGVKCICEHCGRETSNRNLKKHMTTKNALILFKLENQLLKNA